MTSETGEADVKSGNSSNLFLRLATFVNRMLRDKVSQEGYGNDYLKRPEGVF